MDLKNDTKCTIDETGCGGFDTGVCKEPDCFWINKTKLTIIESNIDAWNNVDVREHLSYKTIKHINTIIRNDSINGFSDYFVGVMDGPGQPTIDSIISAMYMYIHIEGLK